MRSPLLSLATLLLGTALAAAQAPTPPVATPVPATDIPKLAAAYLDKMWIRGPVVCREDTVDGHWTICNAPIDPGITTGITTFVCDAKGCIMPPSYVPAPLGTPVPSTPTK